ncbi:hypothetical protein J5N97_011998 [Dioscorea zingiberensis]|uniref:Uncharacterized protein n=1 Tax=Dioscorea zingiberensis TaxID=325984 RepID=A0A9D5CPD8_9LILI|nr:hypothetical protein J5N97_011998 [Dioscorea zingiberensis]
MAKAMEDAIEAMNGIDLDGRSITVDKAQPQGSGGRDRDYDAWRGVTRDRERSRDHGGGVAAQTVEIASNVASRAFCQECPSGDGARGDRFGGGMTGMVAGMIGMVVEAVEMSRYGGPDRNGDRYGGVAGMGVAWWLRRVIVIARDRSGPYERQVVVGAVATVHNELPFMPGFSFVRDLFMKLLNFVSVNIFGSPFAQPVRFCSSKSSSVVWVPISSFDGGLLNNLFPFGDGSL